MRTKNLSALLCVVFSVGLFGCSSESSGPSEIAFPQPRFPNYVKSPETIEEVMPFARAAVRQTGGRTPLGLIKPGQRVALFAGSQALLHPNPLVLEALVKALQERNVKPRMIFPQPEGTQIRVGNPYTSEKGYMESAGWVGRNWPDPEEPKALLREKNPEIYNALFPEVPPSPRYETLNEDQLEKLDKNPNFEFWSGTPAQYVAEHADEVDVVFFGYGGRTNSRLRLGEHGDKFLGNFMFDTWNEVMTDVNTFPGDLWRLAEERLIEPLGWVDYLHVTDPEGTDFTVSLTEETAKMWSEGVYQQGHLYMYPLQATGRNPYSIKEYPRQREDMWLAPKVPDANGVIASTRNHTGYFPRIELTLEHGKVTEARGGGWYGDILRTFLDYPKLSEVQYPYHEEKGYWFLYEAGTGTNPKFYLRPDGLRSGRNTSERNVAGVIHWALGVDVFHDKPGMEGTWKKFTQEQNVPPQHGFHFHNNLVTYKYRIRGTEQMRPLIEKGRVSVLDNPEVRALASRYGDPDLIMRQEWVPDTPGITSPGSYEEFSQNPWAHMSKMLQEVEDGTYAYFGGRD